VTDQTFAGRAGEQPALAVILLVAGVVGFGIGTWLGNATKPPSAAEAVASPSIAVVTPSPLATTSVTPSPEPTEKPALTQAPPGQPGIIFSIEGSKHEVTDSFVARPGWQVQWQVDGQSIAIAVTGDPNLGVVIDQKGPASGVTGIAEGGEFSLTIEADGPWKVSVIDGEEPAAS
jgi:hypothetical protein